MSNALIERPSNTHMNPHLIASGLGLADRKEISGLLALFKASNLLDAGVGAWKNLLGNLGLEMRKQGQRVSDYSQDFFSSSRSDDELRHMLWLNLTRGLDLGVNFALSDRITAETASALGVMASTVLSPGLHAEEMKRNADKSGNGGDWNKWFQKHLKNPGLLWRSDAPLPFPEIVTRELAKLLSDEDVRDGVDPEVAQAMGKAGNRAMAIVAAGGGWAGLATVVGGAGFYPYMLAAQASAFIPFMGGPAVVSLLAVLVNPVTVVAGLAAMGGLGGVKLSNAIRRQVAARIAVLLAVRGTEDPAMGLARLVDSLRNVTREGRSDLLYMSEPERQKLRTRVKLVETRLGRDIPQCAGIPPPDLRELPKQGGRSTQLEEAAAVAGLTAGELLYRAATIDDRVIHAADFWRAADLAHPFAFAAYAHELSMAGADIALRGYVAEHVVMGQLIAEGHAVSLPAAANNPGYDLIVNGQPVQVKCGLSLDLLREHFGKYPDIPVISNTELMEAAAGETWSDLVSTVEGFEIEAITAITNQAVEAGLDLASMDVLASALGVGAFRGGIAVLRGEIPATDLPAWLVVDAALKIPMVGIGGQLGGLVGLIAIGPAGALILGPVAGAAAVLGVGPAKGAFDRVANKTWHKQMQSRGAALHEALVTALNHRANRVIDRSCRLRAASLGASPDLSIWIDLRSCEDSIFAIELLESLALPPKTPTQAMTLLLEASRTAPVDPSVLRSGAALKRCLEGRPGPLGGVADLWTHVASRSPLKT